MQLLLEAGPLVVRMFTLLHSSTKKQHTGQESKTVPSECEADKPKTNCAKAVTNIVTAVPPTAEASFNGSTIALIVHNVILKENED